MFCCWGWIQRENPKTQYCESNAVGSVDLRKRKSKCIDKKTKEEKKKQNNNNFWVLTIQHLLYPKYFVHINHTSSQRPHKVHAIVILLILYMKNWGSGSFKDYPKLLRKWSSLYYNAVLGQAINWGFFFREHLNWALKGMRNTSLVTLRMWGMVKHPGEKTTVQRH